MALQNGRYFSPERSVEIKRLDGQAGSEGWILLCPDAHGLHEISSFQVGKFHKGTQLPFIWLRPAPRKFTKIFKPVLAFLQKRGMRLIIYEDNIVILNQDQQDLIKDRDTVIFILWSRTNSDVGIPRHVDRLCNYDSVPSREEVEIVFHHSEMSVPACKNSSDDQRGFRIYRHVISRYTSSVVSSLALQEATNDSDGGSFIPHSHQNLSCLKSGIDYT